MYCSLTEVHVPQRGPLHGSAFPPQRKTPQRPHLCLSSASPVWLYHHITMQPVPGLLHHGAILGTNHSRVPSHSCWATPAEHIFLRVPGLPISHSAAVLGVSISWILNYTYIQGVPCCYSRLFKSFLVAGTVKWSTSFN